jgi:type IV pilus assembly protein PilX
MNKFNRQKGAVLVISLIMLLLLTLIGTSSIQTSSLEEKMAGNIRDEDLAFQAAETALRAAEAVVATNPPAFSVVANGTGSTGLYTTIGATLTDPLGFWKTVDWSSTTAVATYSGGTLNNISSVPRYIIEELPTSSGGSSTSSGGSLEAATTSSTTSISWYRVTAHGTGGTTNSVALLQSIYKR